MKRNAADLSRLNADIATNGGWFLTVEIDGVEREWIYQFATENAALLFGAMNFDMIVATLSRAAARAGV